MSFSKFQLSKSWESAEDFPTYEDDESQVRADMQYLFDELEDDLNSHIDEDIASNISFEPTEGVQASTVQSAIELVHAQVVEVSVGTMADGSITNEKLADATAETGHGIETGKIKDAAITTNKIADANVTTAKLADGAVTSAKIADGTIANGDIADATILAGKIADGQVAKLDSLGKAAAAAITTAVIVVTGNKTLAAADNKRFLRVTNAATITIPTYLDAGDITTDFELEVLRAGTGAVTISGADVAMYTVNSNVAISSYSLQQYEYIKLKKTALPNTWLLQGSSFITPGSIDTAQIKDNAITTPKIADGNVTTAKLDASAVTTAKIADANVTEAKLAANAVTTAKITDANVTTAKIADGNVTEAKLAASAVTTAKIADSNVTTAKIADSNVTTAKIADSNVTTAKIADANVTVAKLGADVYSGSDPEDLGTAAPGVAATLSRSDHVHQMPTASQIPSNGSSDVQTDINTINTNLTPTFIPNGISLPTASWAAVSGETDTYSQVVTSQIANATSKTLIDLRPDRATLRQMKNDDTAEIYIENNNGVFTAYAVGDKPTANLTIQATRIESA